MADEPDDASVLAVLTGDIVRSTSLAPAALTALINSIHDAVATFHALYPGSVYGEADIYRGDSWQIAMTRPELSLRLALYLRALVISSQAGLDTRISIGTGAGNTIALDRVSRSTGDAFLRSGRALDSIGDRRVVVVMPDAPSDTQALVQCVAALVDRLVSGLTLKQAHAMRRVLENPGKPDADIANARLSDSERRNFTKLKNRAQADLVDNVLATFEGLSLWAHKT